MAEKKTTKTEEKKQPTYEQLMATCESLVAQLNNKNRMEQLNEVTARLNFLFRVMEFADRFPESYVSECVSDIIKILPAGEKPENNAE